MTADSDDEKKLFKAEARAGRKKSKTKKPYKKPGGWWQKIAANSNMAAGTSAGLGGQVSASSAAVLPQPAGTQLGPCFVCGKMGHF